MPPVPQAGPTSAMARVSMADDGDNPKWAGVRGVTGDEAREQELGSGKWTEETQGHLDEVRQAMSDAPVREIDLEPSGPNWAILGAAGALILLLVGWAVLSSVSGDQDATPAEPGAPPPPAQVEIQVEPAGATVFFDDRKLGTAPVTLPIPADASAHQLCAEAEGRDRTCEEVTASRLVAQDPYILRMR